MKFSLSTLTLLGYQFQKHFRQICKRGDYRASEEVKPKSRLAAS
jgi:hypothetical protein